MTASQDEEVERAGERDGEDEVPSVREIASGAGGTRKYRERAREESDHVEDDEQRGDKYERIGRQDRHSDYRDAGRHESRQELRQESRYDSRQESRHESRGERDRRTVYNGRERGRRGYRNDYSPSAGPSPSPSPRRSSSGMHMSSIHYTFLGFYESDARQCLVLIRSHY